MKKVSKKVVRLIELAKEFEKSEKDIFGEETNAVDFSTLKLESGSIGWREIEDKRVGFTRGQLIESKAKFAKEKADRYDEYQALKREVSEYFQAKLTINK